jgi:hypothetical protein
MKKLITRYTVAAAIVVMAALGVFQFIGTGRRTGVVWAEVPERIAQTTGHIRRITEAWDKLAPDGTEEIRCKFFHWSPEYGSRMDYYRDNRMVRQWFLSAETQQHVSIDHEHKTYELRDYDPEPMQWNVKDWVERYLSAGGKSLGRRVIDGREAEGFEVKKADPMETNVIGDADWLRLWVDVETGYPLLQEDVITTQRSRCHAIEDRQQWDVKFEPEDFIPIIPSDYKLGHDLRGK